MDRVQIICPECESPLLQAEKWEQTGEETWEIALRCPDCCWAEHGIFETLAMLALREALDSGIEEIEAAVAEAEQREMAAWAGRFTAALAADAITPDDF